MTSRAMRSTASAARAGSTPATSRTSLAIKTVLIHPLSSLLSAYGMGLADIGAHRGQGVEGELSAKTLGRLASLVRRLASEAAKEVAAQGVAKADVVTRPRAQLRYAGSDTALEVDYSDERRKCGARSKRRTRRASASSIAPRASSSRRSMSRRAAARRVSPSARGRLARSSGRSRRGRRDFSPTAPGATRAFTCARLCRSARASRARRSSSSRIKPSSSRMAGARKLRRRTMS